MLINVNAMGTSMYSVITKEGMGSEKDNFWLRSYVQYERNDKTMRILEQVQHFVPHSNIEIFLIFFLLVM